MPLTSTLLLSSFMARLFVWSCLLVALLAVPIRGLVKISVNDFKVSISDARTSAAPVVHKAKFPETVKFGLGPENTVEISFVVQDSGSGQSVKAEQSVVRFSTNAREAIAPAIYADSVYKCTLDLSSNASKLLFGDLEGELGLELLVGDDAFNAPVLWKAGHVQLQRLSNKIPGEPRYVFNVLPEIQPTFSLPEKRPGHFLSLLFTGLVVLPLVGALVAWAFLGTNLHGFPTGSGFLPTVGFGVGYLAILTLLAMFWWQLNIFELLTWLAPTALLTAIFGRSALATLESNFRL